jgi:hypothetical protein
MIRTHRRELEFFGYRFSGPMAIGTVTPSRKANKRGMVSSFQYQRDYRRYPQLPTLNPRQL